MKAVYCRTCRQVSLKSRIERDVCNVCGRSATPVPVRRPWQYYASGAILLVTAGLLFVVSIPELAVRLGIFVAALAVSVGLSLWSARDLRSRILRQVEGVEDTPGAHP